MKGQAGGREISSFCECPPCIHLPCFDGFLIGKTIFLVIITIKLPYVETTGNMNTRTQTRAGLDHGLKTAGSQFSVRAMIFKIYKSMETLH